MNLGNALRTLREARGMTQEQLAKVLKAANPRNWEGEAHEVETFESHTEWCVKGLEEEFARALGIPESLFVLFAASDEELGVGIGLAMKVRKLALDLMRPEEGEQL